jgi:hypothetical protein
LIEISHRVIGGPTFPGPVGIHAGKDGLEDPAALLQLHYGPNSGRSSGVTGFTCSGAFLII